MIVAAFELKLTKVVALIKSRRAELKIMSGGGVVDRHY
jgi:hypothetical protein